MNESRNYYSARDYIENHLNYNVENWEDFVDFISDFEETNDDLSNLETSKLNQYTVLYSQKLKKNKRKTHNQKIANPNSKSCEFIKSLLTEKAPDFIRINNGDDQNEEVIETFDFEPKNQVKISEIFDENIEVILEKVKNGTLLNQSPTFTFIASPAKVEEASNPFFWRTDRSFNEILEFFKSLRTIYPTCVVH